MQFLPPDQSQHSWSQKSNQTFLLIFVTRQCQILSSSTCKHKQCLQAILRSVHWCYVIYWLKLCLLLDHSKQKKKKVSRQRTRATTRAAADCQATMERLRAPESGEEVVVMAVVVEEDGGWDVANEISFDLSTFTLSWIWSSSSKKCFTSDSVSFCWDQKRGKKSLNENFCINIRSIDHWGKISQLFNVIDDMTLNFTLMIRVWFNGTCTKHNQEN